MLDPDLELRRIVVDRKIARAKRLHALHPIIRIEIVVLIAALGFALYFVIPFFWLVLAIEAYRWLWWPEAVASTVATVATAPVYGYGVHLIHAPALDILDGVIDGVDDSLRNELRAIEIESDRRLHELGPPGGIG